MVKEILRLAVERFSRVASLSPTSQLASPCRSPVLVFSFCFAAVAVYRFGRRNELPAQGYQDEEHVRRAEPLSGVGSAGGGRLRGRSAWPGNGAMPGFEQGLYLTSGEGVGAAWSWCFV